MALDARGIAEAWSRVVAHLGIEVDADRLAAAAVALEADPAAAWADARRELAATGAPAHVVRRALFALFGIVTDRDPAVAEQAAPALALLAGAPSLAAVPQRRDVLERVHDGPLQDAIALQLQVRRDPALAELHLALAGLVTSLRSVIADAQSDRPAAGSGHSVDAAFRAQLEAAARRCPWAHVTVSCDLPSGLTDEVVDLALRVVQESLANLRHANAHRAWVEMRCDSDVVRVQVGDDGAGFDSRKAIVPRPGHLGLAWLRDVVSAAGGRLTVRSAAGLGTRVSAELPLDAREFVNPTLTTTLSA